MVPGVVVELHPVGRPDQAVESRLSWVAGAAAVRNRQSPVKYLLMRAPVPAEVALRHAWVPGQAFRARLFVQRKEEGVSVANVAVRSEAGRTSVQVREGGALRTREITLGARGPARSEVLSGLEPGDLVVLVPPRDAAPETAEAAPSGGAGR
jgi:HlyD family secretion protein